MFGIAEAADWFQIGLEGAFRWVASRYVSDGPFFVFRPTLWEVRG